MSADAGTTSARLLGELVLAARAQATPPSSTSLAQHAQVELSLPDGQTRFAADLLRRIARLVNRHVTPHPGRALTPGGSPNSLALRLLVPRSNDVYDRLGAVYAIQQLVDVQVSGRCFAQTCLPLAHPL